MKKIISVLICIIFCICTCVPAYAESLKCTSVINLNDSEISSNLVCNNSFEFSKPEAFWKFKNISYEIKNDSPINKNNSNYLALSVQEKGLISCLGYNTDIEKPKANIHFTEDEKYDFSCYIKNIDFNGTVYVYLNSKNNKNIITELDISNIFTDWKRIFCEIESLATETGSLTFEFNGNGTILLDFVQLIPHSAYGYGEEQYKYSTINSQAKNEILESDKKYVEKTFGNSNDWKNSIGAIEERQDSGYLSNQIGIVEYLNLCEETQKNFLPTFYNTDISIPNILDLIEFANGDSVKTYWGAIRAANGHPEPYNITEIGICSQTAANGDEASAKELQEAIEKKYNGITVLEVEANCEPFSFQFIADSKPAANYTQTILLIAAPCAAVIAASVIAIVVVKKRKK